MSKVAALLPIRSRKQNRCRRWGRDVRICRRTMDNILKRIGEFPNRPLEGAELDNPADLADRSMFCGETAARDRFQWKCFPKGGPMTTTPPRRSIVIAMRGCGKTWTLSTRFARWCLDRLARGKASPERILALTFTRKAAGEILEAVVLRFTEALDGDKAVMAALGTHLSMPCVGDVGVCTSHPATLNTIDGFFNQLCARVL